MSLLNYWPTAEEVNLCINHEAEGAHDAVLLAVHQPSPLTYQLASTTLTSSGEKVVSNEDELFKYLITRDVPSGAHVIPITGESGVGKSHMVRILAARLQSANEDGRYVMIRIPKSASLRKVVELILDKLSGDEYAKVKAEFAKALSEVNVDTAAINFQSQLDIALGELAKELRSKVQADPGNSALKEQFGHAVNLPKFIGDPLLVDYFRSKVFPKFVQRAVGGAKTTEPDARIEDFHADDFLLPSSIEITKAALPTQSYYTRNLLIREGEGRRVVARLLNDNNVVDLAIGQLFKLQESLGGMTLQEVILEIRRLLLKQGRELVILVEDFKALTGIQDTLLNVLIQEGVREGTRELATMRSVIAVTDGYLREKDTIATRAKRVWKVESHLSSDAEVLRRTKALVASYLNAARWGYGELVLQFERNGGARSGQHVRIGPYVDDDAGDSTVLTAFGVEGEIPLFPYTDNAIEQLARSTLTQNNALVFTPRFIIDNILRALLLPGRPAFERGQFPPPDINAPATNAEVTQWIASLPVSNEVRERYRRVVAIWGNGPNKPAEIGYIPKEVFDAFRLDRPNVDFCPPPLPNPIVDDTPRPTTETKPDDEHLTGALEKWVQKKERLPQLLANQIRQSIASALNARIDWPAERCAKSPINNKQISIPNAFGNSGLAAEVVEVAPDNTDPTGQIRAELAAVTRFYHLNASKTDYLGVDDDLVWIGSLTDRLMPQALALVRASMCQKLGVATRLLSTNSRILGLIERGRTPASLASFLFGEPLIPQRLPEGAPAEFSDWRAMQEQALRIRPELMQLVASFCGSFQGDGKTAYAMDMVRVTECLLPESESIDLSTLNTLSLDLKQAVQAMSEPRVKALARKVSQKATNNRTNVTAELGDTFDKQAVTEELKALADQLKDSGVWNTDEIGVSHIAFRTICDEFRGCALREALSVLAASGEGEEGANESQLVSRMGRFDIHPVLIASRFVETARKVVRAAEKRAKSLEEQFKGVDPQAKAGEIQALFQQLVNEMNALGAEGETACF
ncbi:protein DpdH [Paraburkholderia caballeronis]|uniref:protein DpdH n=1 Tax=Paraburkholderia caballeronis TaxID=416943 RepID=UPI00106649F7|nr:protein DpdH [Paraburkholderia caballeronis]TDV02650.1 hypothetical protein C7408_14112 [Paraburkholderia caballeronis]TDV06869.1 hypothetical protein C7406_1405 [Paraburkholderia caballeronis]TDV17016.1 hypothetical protein C7404_14011 [Paraburkholderia caballeronis]